MLKRILYTLFVALSLLNMVLVVTHALDAGMVIAKPTPPSMSYAMEMEYNAEFAKYKVWFAELDSFDTVCPNGLPSTEWMARKCPQRFHRLSSESDVIVADAAEVSKHWDPIYQYLYAKVHPYGTN